jgi:hypothetical protein
MKPALVNRLTENKKITLHSRYGSKADVLYATNGSDSVGNSEVMVNDVVNVINTTGDDNFTREKALMLVRERGCIVVNLETGTFKKCSEVTDSPVWGVYQQVDNLPYRIPKDKKHKFVKNGVAGVFNKNNQLRKQAPDMVTKLLTLLNVTKV